MATAKQLKRTKRNTKAFRKSIPKRPPKVLQTSFTFNSGGRKRPMNALRAKQWSVKGLQDD